ncbi:MAG: hypothetical protein NT135_01370 [Candidatus Berkelbacteria bacterium]|nr:hypothetical protein [Candidatus Berkelbacteria bacterium]
MQNNKKLIIIAIILVVATTAAVIVLLLLKQKKQGGTTKQTTVSKPIEEIVSITQTGVIFPGLAQDQQTIGFVDKNKPGFRTVNLMDKKISDIIEAKNILEKGLTQKVIWSPSGQKVLIKISEDQTKLVRFWLFDLKTKKEESLNPDIQDVLWINDEQILYSYMDSKNYQCSFNISLPNGTNWKKISEIKDVIPKELFKYDQKLNAVLFGTGSDEINNQLYLTDIKSGKADKLIDNYSAVYASPVTDNIAVLATADSKQITLINISNKAKEEYKFDTEIRAIVVNEKIFATTKNEPKNKIYSIDPENKTKTEIKYNTQVNVIKPGNLMLISDGKTLYFTSDDSLYKLDI